MKIENLSNLHDSEIVAFRHINSFVTILGRKVSYNLKKCFNPPVIIKDAD